MTDLSYSAQTAIDTARLWLESGRKDEFWAPEPIREFLESLPETVTEMDPETESRITELFDEWVEDGWAESGTDEENDPDYWNEGGPDDEAEEVDPDLEPDPEDV